MNRKAVKFSFSKRLLSFRFAFKGIYLMLKTQHNAWIHLVAAIAVIIAGCWYSISSLEWALVIIAIGMVFAAETFNTAIEMLVDKISPDFDEQAGRVKDMAAGAVLFAAIAAAIVGVIVFGGKIGI